MRRICLIALTVLVSAACNLTSSPPTVGPTFLPSVPAATFAIATGLPSSIPDPPTLLPLPNTPATSIPVTSAPLIGGLCQVYTTYSGARADNRLSLRSGPSAAATQVFRVPNNVDVLLVPGVSEVEAEGYHWLNVIYQQSPQLRYMGWIARDSYQLNGVRDPSVATLRPTGRQSPC